MTDKFGFLMPGSASDFINDVTAGITAGKAAFLEEWKSMINAPIDWMKNKGKALVEGGKNLVKGISEGINKVKDDPVGAIKSVGSSIKGGFDKVMSIFSPSDEMSKSGAFLSEGVGEGIKKNEGSALDSIMGLGKSLLDATESYMPDIGGMFGGLGASLSGGLEEELGAMGKALSGFGGLETFGLGSFKEMFKVFTPQGGLFGDVTPEVLEGMIAQADGILASANQLISILETIKETVEGIPEIKIDKTIDEIEKGTQVVKDFSKIKDKPLALTVTLNIRMNAEQIAMELLNTDAMKVVAKV